VTTCPNPRSGDIGPQVVCPSSTSSACDAGEARVRRPPRCWPTVVPASVHRYHLQDRASWSPRRPKRLDVDGVPKSSQRPAHLALVLGSLWLWLFGLEPWWSLAIYMLGDGRRLRWPQVPLMLAVAVSSPRSSSGWGSAFTYRRLWGLRRLTQLELER